ncbi:hypothetical protein V6N12_046808 [Hibiscus sabdariffa]|uniref:Uncharacterized protein n=1 Tax=Hibiscus sabdariffa TaxID=183260 RepID=A0ABR2BBI3_9ROSI
MNAVHVRNQKHELTPPRNSLFAEGYQVQARQAVTGLRDKPVTKHDALPNSEVPAKIICPGRTHCLPAEASPLSSSPITAQTTSADQPIAEASPKRKGKTPAGRTITRTDPSSPEEEQAAHQPAQKRRQYHIITSDSADEQSAAIPDT